MSGASASRDWRIYLGTGATHDGIDRLPEPPQWRRFGGRVLDPAPDWGDLSIGSAPGASERAHAYRPGPDVVDAVNAALYLRRPLLVTGKPGTGKSTLAFSVAYELGLGPVLYWPVTSRSTLDDALYRYDAIGRLQEANMRRASEPAAEPADHHDVGQYLRLGPLGTAMLPAERPRVLLIDELDKSDVDLPNDLLNVFEEGRYDIPALARLPESMPRVPVMTADPGRTATVERGQVTCRAFPIVVITSNAEREFPPAFLRRCVQVNIPIPDSAKLAGIVAAQLGPATSAASAALIQRFVTRRDEVDLATDQLLNAIYLTMRDNQSPEDRDRLIRIALRAIGSPVGPQ
jgi:MoxR-like ATPase